MASVSVIDCGGLVIPLTPERGPPQPDSASLGSYVDLVRAAVEGHATVLRRLAEGAVTCLVLKGVFDPSEFEVPEAPDGTFQTPWSPQWWNIGFSILGAVRAVGLEPAAYASENQGELFHSLAVASGEDQSTAKSREALRGHTDACSLFLPGETRREGYSSSPDFVVLSSLRNPERVPTTVYPVDKILTAMGKDLERVLERSIFDVDPQPSFDLDAKLDRLEAVPVIATGSRTRSIRFSHTKVTSTDAEAQRALAEFKRHLEELTPIEVVIAPGTVVLINNRVALHGRATPGKRQPGGRWLLRCYANHPDTPVDTAPGREPWVLGPPPRQRA